MRGGQRQKNQFPSVKGLRTRRTKFGQRWILTEKDEEGHEHCVTVPINDDDTDETFMRKVEAAREKLNSRNNVTFDELLERFFEARMLSNGTRRLYRFATNGFTLDNAKNREAMRALLAKHAKKTTLSVYIQKIRCFFSWAKSRGANVENPAEGIECRCQASSRSRVMTESEIARTLAYAARASPNYRLFILMLMHTGARVSTIQCLQKSDLVGGDIQLYNVKSKRFYEYRIPIHNPEILELWEKTSDGLIFGSDGKKFAKRLNSWLREQFGVDAKGETISVHTIRHTFASRAVQNGVPLEIVSKLLDHQSMSVTAKYYAKFSPKQIADAVAKAVKDFPT